MKRLHFLPFALVVFVLIANSAAFANITFTNPQLRLVDVDPAEDHQGIGLIGRRIEISVVATYTDPSTNWLLPPQVNLEDVGGPDNYQLNPDGDVENGYIRTFILPDRTDDLTGVRDQPHNSDIGLEITAFTDVDVQTIQTDPIRFDLVRPSTGNVAANAPTVTPGIIGMETPFTIRIRDKNWHETPALTQVRVNLTPIGGPADAVLIHQGGSLFEGTFNSGAMDPTAYIGPLTITVTGPYHPMNQERTFQTNPITFDNREIFVDPNLTRIEIRSPHGELLDQAFDGETTDVAVLPDMRIRVIGAVSNYDGFTLVNVSAPQLIPAAIESANGNPLNSNDFQMTLRQGGPGTPAAWWNDIVVQEANFREMSGIPFTLTFTNLVGTTFTATINVRIDLKPPRILVASTTVLLPDDAFSPVQDVATATCHLVFYTEINDRNDDDVELVTVDLSVLNGGDAFVLQPVGADGERFRGRFEIPFGNLDDEVFQQEFVISARDIAGNEIASTTLPPIGIDNNPPEILSAVLTTSSLSGNIIVGDEFTIEAEVTGVERKSTTIPGVNASVSVDLSALGMGWEPLDDLGGNNYRGTWTLPPSTDPNVDVIEELTSFTVYANDTAYSISNGQRYMAHIVTRDTNGLIVDNQVPYIASAGYFPHPVADAPGTHPPDRPQAYVRIGDVITFYADVASNPSIVTIDLSPFEELPYVRNMVQPVEPSIRWTYQYTIPESGNINIWDPTEFEVVAVDQHGNATSTDIPMPVDTRRIVAQDFTLEIGYKPGHTDPVPDIINLNKTASFVVTFLQPLPDDVTSATINLSAIGGSAIATMTRNGNQFEIGPIDVESAGVFSSNYQFEAILYDKAGNTTQVFAPGVLINTRPPEILSATAIPVPSHSPLLIGDQIDFEVETINYQSGNIPVLDLSRIGGDSQQPMTFVNTGPAPDQVNYRFTTTIATGTSVDAFNWGNPSTLASWTVTLRDDQHNVVATNTNGLEVDNLPPQIVGDDEGINVTGYFNPSPPQIRLGDDLVFEIELTNPELLGAGAPAGGSAIIDLTAVGGDENTTMTWFPATHSYRVTHVATTTDQVYMDYRFRAVVTDENGNVFVTYSEIFDTIDCQPVELTNHGIEVNLDPSVMNAGISDMITVYSDVIPGVGIEIEARIGSGTDEFGRAPMVYVAERDRHEADFWVEEYDALGSWNVALIGSNIYYEIIATDTVDNVTEVYGISDFVVYNVMPEISTFSLELDPNFALQFSNGYPVYNIGTDTLGDLLNARIIFSNDREIGDAWLDFSEFGTGTVELNAVASTAETLSGLPVSILPEIDWGDPNYQGSIWIRAQDPGGNQIATSSVFRVDSVPPSVTSATFDGVNLDVTISEVYGNINIDSWSIIGSNSISPNVEEELHFDAGQLTENDPFWPDRFNISLDFEQRKTIAQWASAPLSLRIAADPVALYDLASNSIRPVNYLPITITDYSWRESPVIENIEMFITWAHTTLEDRIEIYFDFSKGMATDPADLATIASYGVIFVDDLLGDFHEPDYKRGYIFREVDDVTWVSDSRLRIILAEDARRWVANKLTNDTSQRLKFATRPMGVFAYCMFGKRLEHIPVTNPIIISDNRPVSEPIFNQPYLSLASRTLRLDTQRSHTLLLNTGDYRTGSDPASPTLLPPYKDPDKSVDSFKNQITLHEFHRNNLRVFNFKDLDIDINDDYASPSVILHLTDDDMLAIFDMFAQTEFHDWRLEIAHGAFKSIWDIPTEVYRPDGPSNVSGMDDFPDPADYASATFAAASMNHVPPFNQKDPGELIFEIEVYPPVLDGLNVPLKSTVHPLVRIITQDDSTHITSGTFLLYNERVVDGNRRAVFRFQNESSFPTNLQRSAALIQIDGVEDIFGQQYSFVASYVYDLNEKNNFVPGGFNTASEPLMIDTVKPEVENVLPDVSIGRKAPGESFFVEYNEQMDTSSALRPSLRVSTDTYSIDFTFVSWNASATVAEFTNNEAFTEFLPNGAWRYEVTGGHDEAGNMQEPYFKSIQVRTYRPEVESITLRTVQSNISNETLINQPWSPDIGPATFSVKYFQPPANHWPHSLELIDEDYNILGSTTLTITIGGQWATATFDYSNFYPPEPGNTGPVEFRTRVVDAVFNRTDPISTVIYDQRAPDVISFDFNSISGPTVGSYTADAIYYRKGEDFNLAFSTATTDDELRLAVYNNINSTQTYDLTRIGSNYSVSEGRLWPNGSYTLSIVDMAGNHPTPTGAPTVNLVVDNTRPWPNEIGPEYAINASLPKPWYIANSAASQSRVLVIYPKPMDASPDARPSLRLATSTVGVSNIQMNFLEWADPLVATTAVFVNADEIGSDVPPGMYYFVLTGGRDLAGNIPHEPFANVFQVNIQSQGPFAVIDTLVDQDHVYGPGTGLLENMHFNRAYGEGTLRITYPGWTFNAPQMLQVFYNDDQVGTYTNLGGDTSIPTDDPGWSWSGVHPFWGGVDQVGSYSFKLLDDEGYQSMEYLPHPLIFDTEHPDVASLSIVGHPGRQWEDIWYYSPDAAGGSATFNIRTINNEEHKMRLVIFDFAGPATSAIDMISSDPNNHSAEFGAALVDGPYMVTSVDLAGNLAEGAASRTLMVVDTIPPQVSDVDPTLTGSMAAETGSFVVEFNEDMNQSVSPVLRLATSSLGVNNINLEFVAWDDSRRARFTNPDPIDSSVTPGTYSYIVTDARDLAGNINIEPSHGSFTIELFTQAPAITANLISRQPRLYDEDLVNRPFSPLVDPSVATLSIDYSDGPFQIPHRLRVYNSNEELVASFVIIPDIPNQKATATVNLAFFGMTAPAPEVGPVSYRFRMVDNIGNISPLSVRRVIYDAASPSIDVATFTNVSVNSQPGLVYYNEQIHGGMNALFETNATDSLVLFVASGTAWNNTTATHPYYMTEGDTDTEHQYSFSVAEAAELDEGNYWITVADMAGNMGYGAASYTELIIDRTPPEVLVATTTNGLPLHSGPAGAATFSIVFNEPIDVNASPTLSISTHTYTIECEFVEWADPAIATTAIFVTAMPVLNSIPQGNYRYRVSAQDITGNVMDVATGSIPVRSRGPIVSSFVTRSFQSTTASSTDEILIDTPFSFGVPPGAATMSIQLAQEPDLEPVYLHFMLDDSTVASHVLVLDPQLAATFTWSITASPTTAIPRTYKVRLTDGAGDFSLESHEWSIDNVRPLVSEPVVTRAEPFDGEVYFNPSRHHYIRIEFESGEMGDLRARIRGANSTDTYNLSKSDTKFATNFYGRYSRESADGTKKEMPDGIYYLDVVDEAGNVSLLPDGVTEIDYRIIIDTQAPVVASYSLEVNSETVTRYSPSAGNLEITVHSPDPFVATSVYQIEILNSSRMRVNRIVVDPVTGIAEWDGTNFDGDLVNDGTYIFVATDKTGNRADEETSILTITSTFKVTAASQIGSASALLRFSQEIDPDSIGQVPIAHIDVSSVDTNITVDQSSITAAEGNHAVRFNVSAFEHGVEYTFTIATGSIRSIYGATIQEPDNSAAIVADAQGPVIEEVDFENVDSPRKFYIVFDKQFKASTAGNVDNYTLIGPQGQSVSLDSAVTQSGRRKVLMSALTELEENEYYTINAQNIEDDLGNKADSSLEFRALDRTPPELLVSAFSNPANENDIIVVVVANEPLDGPPNLKVVQANAPPVNTVMQQGASNQSYMVGVSLSPSYPGNGTLTATARDLAGNVGVGTANFVVAHISASMVASLRSADNLLRVDFNADSLREDAMVKILSHSIEIEESDASVLRLSLQNHAFNALPSLRGSDNSDFAALNHAELEPVGKGYEIGIDNRKIHRGFNIVVEPESATETENIGLYYQDGDLWRFVTPVRDGRFSARVRSAEIFALMRDTVPPLVSMREDDYNLEPFRTARPEFRGAVRDYGSGIDRENVVAHVNRGPAQPVIVDRRGNFVFVPQADLTGGNHEMVIRASDRAGNITETESIRFSVSVPLEIHQIMQYPNPARNRAFIRISANRADLDDSLVRIRIFDSSGHRVTELEGVRPSRETWGVNARYLYDIPWDLRNSRGRPVANGVYFARLELTDPDDPGRKIRQNFKLAVLR